MKQKLAELQIDNQDNPIIEQKIEQARLLLKELDQDKWESPFEKARRFLVIQESLVKLRKIGID